MSEATRVKFVAPKATAKVVDGEYVVTLADTTPAPVVTRMARYDQCCIVSVMGISKCSSRYDLH